MRFVEELELILDRVPPKFWVAVVGGPLLASLGLYFASNAIQPSDASSLVSRLVAVRLSAIVTQIELISLMTWGASWWAAVRIYIRTRRRLLGG